MCRRCSRGGGGGWAGGEGKAGGEGSVMNFHRWSSEVEKVEKYGRR